MTAVAVLSGINVYKSHKETKFNVLTMANIEALADMEGDGSIDGESGGFKHYCYDRYSSADWFHKDEIFIWCMGCVPEKGHNLQDRNQCISNY